MRHLVAGCQAVSLSAASIDLILDRRRRVPACSGPVRMTEPARTHMKRPSNTGLTLLRVSRLAAGRPWGGKLIAGPLVLPCALGRAGLAHRKREGDGATPAGRRRVLLFLLRRETRPAALRAPTRFIRKGDVWCDDPTSFSYNRSLRGPSRLGHEELWRADRLYDVIGVLDYNIRPRVLGRGSAIFLHIATDDLAATAGCVALRPRDMARLLPRLARRATLVIG